MIGFYEVFMILRLFIALGISYWIMFGPIFVSIDVIFLNCVVTNIPFRGEPILYNKLPRMHTCGLADYIRSWIRCREVSQRK